MAEVRQSTLAGENTSRFLTFLMVQERQASLFLGRLPHPQTGRTEVNLPVAKVCIEQLEMIRDKTQGNLTGEEERILDGMIGDLQSAYTAASEAAV